MHDAQNSLAAMAVHSALVISVLCKAGAGNGLCLHAELDIAQC